MKKATKKTIKKRNIERGETHFNRGQTTKILTLGFFFLLGYIVVVPPTPTTTDTAVEQMIFQFHGAATDWGVTGTQVHGAADRRGYLFDGATGGTQTFTGSVTSSTTSNAVSTTSSLLGGATSTKYARIIVGNITIPNYYVAVETLVFSPDLARYYLENFLEGDRSKLSYVSSTGYVPKNCVSPSGETVAHGDFILAYQQRTDVTTICNVEKRYCNDGTLLGSYTQEFCDDKTPYAYEDVAPTSYNSNTPSEYVQPSAPANANADFNNQGELNAPLDPTTRWEPEPANAQIVKSGSVAQTVVTYKDCRTPWNEKVLNNQFVRAYQANQGYANRPCEVEIRMCMNGHLKGTFKYKACAYTGASYEMVHGIN